jgi:hypothetical protein
MNDIGFKQDPRSRQELERDGYTYMETVTAPISHKDRTVIKVEIYMKGDEMVMKILETPELTRLMKLLEEEDETA